MSTLTHRQQSSSTRKDLSESKRSPQQHLKSGQERSNLTHRKPSSSTKNGLSDNTARRQKGEKALESPQRKRSRSLSRDRFPANPYIAWPTVFLGVFSLCLWVGSLICMLSHALPRYICVPISTIAVFLCFTPVHDASHRAIGYQDSFALLVNEVIGRLCVLPLLFPFAVFRYMHLLHHRHTNVPELDPDHFTQRSFVQCILGEFQYYLYLLKPRNFRHVPMEVWGETLLDMVCIAAGLGYWVRNFGLENVFWGVLLPQRLAAFYLLYTFDRVPHKGSKADPKHLVTKHINGFISSSNVNDKEPARWKSFFLRLVLMNQDAHAIHHQYPIVPFYNYHTIWEIKKDKLYEMGLQNTSLLQPK